MAGKAKTAAALIERRILVIRDQRVMVDDEADSLRLQIATSNTGRGFAPHSFTQEAKSLLLQMAISKGRDEGRTPSFAFTQEGVAMLREDVASHRDLAHKIDALESKYASHDDEIRTILQVIRKLVEPPATPRRRIGFRTPEEGRS